MREYISHPFSMKMYYFAFALLLSVVAFSKIAVMWLLAVFILLACFHFALFISLFFVPQVSYENGFLILRSHNFLPPVKVKLGDVELMIKEASHNKVSFNFELTDGRVVKYSPFDKSEKNIEAINLFLEDVIKAHRNR